MKILLDNWPYIKIQKASFVDKRQTLQPDVVDHIPRQQSMTPNLNIKRQMNTRKNMYMAYETSMGSYPQQKGYNRTQTTNQSKEDITGNASVNLQFSEAFTGNMDHHQEIANVRPAQSLTPMSHVGMKTQKKYLAVGEEYYQKVEPTGDPSKTIDFYISVSHKNRPQSRQFLNTFDDTEFKKRFNPGLFHQKRLSHKTQTPCSAMRTMDTSELITKDFQDVKIENNQNAIKFEDNTSTSFTTYKLPQKKIKLKQKTAPLFTNSNQYLVQGNQWDQNDDLPEDDNKKTAQPQYFNQTLSDLQLNINAESKVFSISTHTPLDQLHQEKMMILNKLIKSPTVNNRDTSPHFSWRCNTKSRITHFQNRLKNIQAQQLKAPQIWKSSENRPNNYARRLLVASQPERKFLSGQQSDLNDDLEMNVTIKNSSEKEKDNGRYMSSDEKQKPNHSTIKKKRKHFEIKKQKLLLEHNPMRERADHMIHLIKQSRDDQIKQKHLSAKEKFKHLMATINDTQKIQVLNDYLNSVKNYSSYQHYQYDSPGALSRYNSPTSARKYMQKNIAANVVSFSPRSENSSGQPSAKASRKSLPAS